MVQQFSEGIVAPAIANQSLINLGTFNNVPYTLNLKLTTGNFLSTSFMETVRRVLASIIWFVFFMLGNKALQDQVSGVMNQRQVQGTTQSILGVNLSAVAASVFITIIVSSIYFLGASFASDGVLSYFEASSYSGGVSSKPYFITWLSNAHLTIPAWDVVTSMCPIGEIAAAFVSYMVWTKIVMWPVFLGARTAILFLFN